MTLKIKLSKKDEDRLKTLAEKSFDEEGHSIQHDRQRVNIISKLKNSSIDKDSTLNNRTSPKPISQMSPKNMNINVVISQSPTKTHDK